MSDRNTSFLLRLRDVLVSRSRNEKIALSVFADIFGFSACALAAFWVLGTPVQPLWPLLAMAAVAAVTAISLVWLLGLYRSIVRYVGLDLIVSAALVNVGSAAILASLGMLTGVIESPIRWALSFLAFALIYLSASRYIMSEFLTRARGRGKRENILIYGAGQAGAQLSLALRRSPGFRVVAMVDDDSNLHGKKVKGLEVYPASDLETLIEKFRIGRVLLAMPIIQPPRNNEIIGTNTVPKGSR